MAAFPPPKARLKVLERCGHLPMVEKPEAFHRLLYGFLVGVEEKLPDRRAGLITPPAPKAV
jgi:hypothetical protein